MFYVLIFGLVAVLLVVAFLTIMSRRRRNLGSEQVHATYGEGQPTHATHGSHASHVDAAGRRNRKAKRAQSQHDRRKRH